MKHVDINIISTVAAHVRELLGDDFDQETFLDTVDGETDVNDFLGHLITCRVEAQATEASLKNVAAAYTARAKRFDQQAKACTDGIGRLLDALGESKIQHDLATAIRTKPRQSVVITDERLIPTQLCKSEPDKAAVKTQLEAGVEVPGASLELGSPGVSVRVK